MEARGSLGASFSAARRGADVRPGRPVAVRRPWGFWNGSVRTERVIQGVVAQKVTFVVEYHGVIGSARPETDAWLMASASSPAGPAGKLTQSREETRRGEQLMSDLGVDAEGMENIRLAFAYALACREGDTVLAAEIAGSSPPGRGCRRDVLRGQDAHDDRG